MKLMRNVVLTSKVNNFFLNPALTLNDLHFIIKPKIKDNSYI